MTNLQTANDTVKPVVGKDLQPQIQNEAGSVNNTWDYEEILKILGFGKTQWILLLVSGLLTTSSVAAWLATSIIVISSQCEFNMTQNEKGVMMTAYLAGKVVSTYIWGYISDVWGRKPILVWTTLFATFLQFISMFVTNIWLFNFINFIIGISLGTETGVKFAYISEFCTSKHRPIVVNYSTMFFSLTCIYLPAVSWWVLSTDWSFHITDAFVIHSWRFIIFFCLLPGLISGLILLPYPESPKFLLALGKHDEAVKALDWISKNNRNLSLKAILKSSSSITVRTGEETDANLLEMGKGWGIFKNIWKSTLDMFHKPHGWNVSILISCLFGLMFASNGLQMWFPDMVNRSIAGSQTDSNFTACELIRESYRGKRLNGTDLNDGVEISVICDDTISTQTYVDTIIMGVAFLVGYAIQGAVLNFLCRKYILFSCLTVAAICGILFHVITSTTGVLVLFCLYIILPGLVISILIGALVDLVPTYLRGKVVSFGFTVSHVSLIIGTNFTAIMMESYCNSVFVITTVIIIVCEILAYFLPI